MQYILKNEAVRSFRRVQGKSKPGFHDLVPITAPQNDKGPKAHRIPGSFFVTYRATRDFEITESISKCTQCCQCAHKKATSRHLSGNLVVHQISR